MMFIIINASMQQNQLNQQFSFRSCLLGVRNHLHKITRTHLHITRGITIQQMCNNTFVSEPNASFLGQTFSLH